MQLIRSASIADYGDLARSFGLDPVELVKKVGLDIECLINPDLKIPISKVDELLELSANAAGIDSFGLRLAENRSISHLGPIALLLREEPDLRQFIDSIQRYIHLHNEALSVPAIWRKNSILVTLEYHVTNWVMQRQSMELAVGFLFRCMQAYLGHEWRPQRVCFRHDKPQNDCGQYLMFGAPVHFSQEFDGLEFPVADANVKRSHDPIMAGYARQYLDLLNAAPDERFSLEVRNLVSIYLPSGRCNVDHIAESLGMERRTFQRRLNKFGIGFSDIVCSVREDLAVRYLSQKSRSLIEITNLLGFVEQSAFSRWFRQTFGITPKQWRAEYQKKTRVVN